MHAPPVPQLWHCGQVGCTQQTPSRQFAEAHSRPAEHVSPSIFLLVSVLVPVVVPPDPPLPRRPPSLAPPEPPPAMSASPVDPPDPRWPPRPSLRALSMPPATSLEPRWPSKPTSPPPSTTSGTPIGTIGKSLDTTASSGVPKGISVNAPTSTEPVPGNSLDAALSGMLAVAAS